jgi:hypothetical protein
MSAPRTLRPPAECPPVELLREKFYIDDTGELRHRERPGSTPRIRPKFLLLRAQGRWFSATPAPFAPQNCTHVIYRILLAYVFSKW